MKYFSLLGIPALVVLMASCSLQPTTSSISAQNALGKSHYAVNGIAGGGADTPQATPSVFMDEGTTRAAFHPNGTVTPQVVEANARRLLANSKLTGLQTRLAPVASLPEVVQKGIRQASDQSVWVVEATGAVNWTFESRNPHGNQPASATETNSKVILTFSPESGEMLCAVNF